MPISTMRAETQAGQHTPIQTADCLNKDTESPEWSHIKQAAQLLPKARERSSGKGKEVQKPPASSIGGRV